MVQKILWNRRKMPFWLIKGVMFFQKLKISKIWNRNFVAGPMKSLSTKNQLILTIPLWLLFFSGEKGGPISQRENRKKSTFFGRKSANFRNFSKILRNLIKHIEIHIWSKFQLNWTFFRQIMAIPNSNFVLFYIYIFIYRVAIINWPVFENEYRQVMSIFFQAVKAKM